uniref:Uncharacterized protein n=1 Tax=Coccidioides posadasii RMSCC 3488 TaxID=454284 RepID=A0A0J6FS81_COCPO|nr:hypothetical protein CPAG_08224 [Coccidioides posadasii RMSCC 3488]
MESRKEHSEAWFYTNSSALPPSFPACEGLNWENTLLSSSVILLATTFRVIMRASIPPLDESIRERASIFILQEF